MGGIKDDQDGVHFAAVMEGVLVPTLVIGPENKQLTFGSNYRWLDNKRLSTENILIFIN